MKASKFKVGQRVTVKGNSNIWVIAKTWDDNDPHTWLNPGEYWLRSGSHERTVALEYEITPIPRNHSNDS